jgi:hypothetical protein
MLPIKQNFLETIHGGKPDRFVNQYEFMELIFGADPIGRNSPYPAPGQTLVNSWGVTYSWPEGTPGGFPVHDAAHKVVKDVTKWRDTVHAPNIVYPESEWVDARKAAAEIVKKEIYAAYMVAPGIFEQCHNLMGIDDCLVNLYEEPDAMKELIAYITNFELTLAEELTSKMGLNLIFHHDDWGSQISTFFSPDMFREFFLDSYKKIYGFYKAHGVEIIVHHADSYAATLVPYMIEAGIDVWQGCLSTNNVPELVKKYGPKISFMGDLNNGVLDKGDVTDEEIRKEVERTCRQNGTHYFIPNLCQGLPMSTYPGVYEKVSAEIDRMSKEMF